VQPGVPIQVRGQGKSGRFITSFAHEKGHRYQVMLTSAEPAPQIVTDITDPDHAVTVGHPDCLQQARVRHTRRERREMREDEAQAQMQTAPKVPAH